MRADARKNRQRLLEAAIELILEIGTEPPLETIARRAGVGIGTLYRRFPDRDALLDAVVQHVFEQSKRAARTASDESKHGSGAIRRYMHEAVDRGVGVLNLIHPLLDGPDWSGYGADAAGQLDEMLSRGKRDGTIRPDTEPSDIVFPIIRFSRPVVIGLTRDAERAIAHRHLDIYIDGLSAVATQLK
jgi:AcrR family transcriptional regulator